MGIRVTEECVHKDMQNNAHFDVYLRDHFRIPEDSYKHLLI